MGRPLRRPPTPRPGTSAATPCPANDGWAAEGAGTTGGAAADDAHVFTVTDRAGLVRALDGGSATPKIIKIAGTIDANTDDDGDRLDCADYATDGYAPEEVPRRLRPPHLGLRQAQRPPGGGPPGLRRAAGRTGRAARRLEHHARRTRRLAVLKGASLQIKDADNVIVRNLDLRDAYDCFPVWQPNTGGLGDWKTAYDNIWLTGATHVWVDHVTLSDKGHPDAKEPTYFARNYLRHDGLLDITNGSDLVTVSWSRFAGHDKAMLIGNGDTATGDRGKLRVTLHHNAFESVVQRAPRVRFGQVHLYNNRYDVDRATTTATPSASPPSPVSTPRTTPSTPPATSRSPTWSRAGTAPPCTRAAPSSTAIRSTCSPSTTPTTRAASVISRPTSAGRLPCTPDRQRRAADREVARGAGAGRIP